MKKRYWISTIIALPLLILGLIISDLSDLRTEEVKRLTIETRKESADRARRLMKNALEAQGMNKLHQFQTFEMTFADDWPGIIGSVANMWKPLADNATLRLRCAIGTFDSSVEVLDGNKKGFTAGLQSWKYYEKQSGRYNFNVEQSEQLYFALPTIQYFMELTERLQTAPILLYGGMGTIGKQQYDMVFATWQTEVPTAQYDQYLLYINRQSHLVEWASYTIRDKSPASLVGTIHYEDFRDIQGIKIPFRQTVVQGKPTTDDKYLHRITLKEFSFDAFSSAALRPDTSLTDMGNAKPAH